jgi:preprotein translocase subunit SecG
MNLFLAVLILVVSTAVTVSVLLLVRRSAPDGGYFNDGDRAAGVFGVLATGFAVLLGFIVFLAFASYDQSRAGAEEEALTVLQQFETAQFLPVDVRAELGGQLICYGRFVVEREWPQMEDGELESQFNPWGLAMFQTFNAVEPESNAEQSAFDKWLDQTSDRESARNDRVHGAEGIVPLSLWVVLFLCAIVIFCYMMFFADSGEAALVQAVQIGTVTIVIVATLLLINILNTPFHPGTGGLSPVAMERTLGVLQAEELEGLGVQGPAPCTEEGDPL